MKYTTEIIIKKPIEEVVKGFVNHENMKYWQPELLSHETIEGRAGEEGAKSRLKYKMGKRKLEMLETIHKRNLPEAYDTVYEAKGVLNIQYNSFEKLGEEETKWISENEFRFKGIMRAMALFMPGAFRKQSMKYMKQFKAFAENNTKR